MEPDELKPDCPCKRINCKRHKNCRACRKHHKDAKYQPACERLKGKSSGRGKGEK